MSSLGDRLAKASDMENPVHIRRYDSQAARQLAVLGLHAHDLRTARAAFASLTSGDRGDIETKGLTGIEEALWCGLVVTYCRCFDRQARSPSHLTPESVFGTDRDGIECHQWLWNERGKYHAHDVNDRRFATVAVVLDREGREFYFEAFTAGVSDTAAGHRTIGQLPEYTSQRSRGSKAAALRLRSPRCGATPKQPERGCR